jgi:hypothetical protein
LQAQSLTTCGKAKVATTSARRSGLCKPNHLHPVERQRWQQHQQGGLDFATPVTYRLWEGKGGNNISKQVWTFQAQSLTTCGKANVATTSACEKVIQYQHDYWYVAILITYKLAWNSACQVMRFFYSFEI